MVKAILASAVLAMAASVAALSETTPKVWNIVNWEAGCAKSGCFYNFNVTSPAYGEIPSFGAYCNGYEDRSKTETFFAPCGIYDKGLGNRGVAAKFVPRKDINKDILKQIEVSFAYTNIATGDVRNFTGFADITINQFVAPRQNYTIRDIEEE